MDLPPQVVQIHLNAEAKDLAIVVNNEGNVVPVSSVKVTGHKFWLIDYFF